MLGALDVTVESFKCGKVLVIVIHSACIGHRPPGLQSGRMLRRSLTRVKPSLANVPVLTSGTSAKQPGCLPPNTRTHAGARSPVGLPDCAAGQDRPFAVCHQATVFSTNHQTLARSGSQPVARTAHRSGTSEQDGLSVLAGRAGLRPKPFDGTRAITFFNFRVSVSLARFSTAFTRKRDAHPTFFNGLLHLSRHEVALLCPARQTWAKSCVRTCSSR